MGFSGITPGSLLLIFFICILLFGSTRIKQLGFDLGQAFKGFKDGMKDDSDNSCPK